MVKKMFSASAFKKILLVAGDLAAFAASLLVSIAIRYPGRTGDTELLQIHFTPFGALFFLWLIVFYVYNLYDLRYGENTISFFSLASQAFALNTLLAIAFFYFNPYVGITPRTVLFVDLLFSAALFGAWRALFNRALSHKLASTVALAGTTPQMLALAQALQEKPMLGWRVAGMITESATPSLPKLPGIPHYTLAQFNTVVEKLEVNLVVLDENTQTTPKDTLALFSLLPKRLSFRTLPSFVERVFQKVPLSSVSESWFLENLSEGEKQFHETLKRLLDVIAAIILGAVTMPLMALVALGIKLEDGRKAFYRQVRVGCGGKTFSVVKFQTMVENAESAGPRWTTKGDPRVTRFGAFLRSTRLDELPQLWNVLRGELSFIGPRPERPEFVENLEKEIPFYGLRHLVRPGLSGWAQINNPLHTVRESYEKLEYDLYYIKNRSFALDTAIALKTLSIILRRKGR